MKRIGKDKRVNAKLEKQKMHLRALEAIISKCGNEAFNTADIIHRELLNRKDGLFKIISEIKSLQWKIVNYAILLFAAIIGVCNVIDFKIVPDLTKLIGVIIFSTIIIIISIISIMMIIKTEHDLGYYRELARLNEHLLSKATGIVFHSNELARSEDDKYEDRPNYKLSAIENRKYFTSIFYSIITISGFISILLNYFSIWIKK